MRERFELKFDDKSNLVVYRWSNPDIDPIGCVQISHGLSEHITRYDDFANFLVSKGFIVVGDDHYQHGESCNDLKKLGKVEEYDFIDAMLKSLHLVREEFSDDFKGTTCLFSHSMGSITAQEYIQKYPNDFQKVILSGTDVGDARYLFLQLITKKSTKKNDCITSSKLVHKITFGSFQKKFPESSEFNWLSKNVENIKKYESDELCGAIVSDSTYHSIAKSLRRTFKNKSIKKINSNIKIFIFSGSEDPVSAMGKSVKKLQKKYQKNNLDVKMKLYEQLRHETLNEIDHQIVYDDIIDFLMK